MRTRSATARTSSPATARGSTTRRSTLVKNDDYTGWPQGRQRWPRRSSSTPRRKRHTPTSRVATSTCSTRSPRARSEPTRTSSATAASTRLLRSSSRSPSRRDCRTSRGEEGKLRRQAISMAINRDEITNVIFAGTRTPAHDFTSPVIDGYSEDLDGTDVLKYNPDEAKKLWAEADAISPWDGTFKIAYNADGGHQGWVDAVSNSIKNVLGIDASGDPYPTFAEARTDDHRPQHPDGVPHRMAGRLPGSVQLPRTALRHRCRLERRRLLEPGRSTSSSPRASPRPTSTPRTRSSRTPRSSPLQGPAGHPALVRDRQRWLWSENVDNVAVRLELGSAVLRDHQDRCE